MADNRRKVLHVVSVSFSLRYFIGDQFHFFGQKGVDFHVACTDSSELDALSNEFKFKKFGLPIKRSISPIQDIISIITLYRYIRKEKFDLVVAHSPKGGLIGMIAAYFARTPKRVFFRHGLVFETANGLKRQLLIVIERVIGYCAHVVVNVSPSVQTEARKLNLNNPVKDTIIGKGTCNGIDTDRFVRKTVQRDNRYTTIGFIGRLTKDKGIIELIQAWSKVQLSVKSSVKLLLVGPVDGRDPLPSDLMCEIESNPTIEYVGEVSDTATYYNLMDVFVLPSYREGFPTVTLEASSSSLPIVTTRCTGCIDSIIENQTGVYTTLNVDDLAEKMLKYINDKELAEFHGKNGRKFVVSNFSHQRFYARLEEEIYNLS